MPKILTVVLWPMTLIHILEEHTASIFKIKVSQLERLAGCMEVISTYQITWCHNPKGHAI
jgi:hypothetical protein